jgi:CCR4-NOT complex subunit CAF16
MASSTISAKHLTFSHNSFSPPCLVDLNLNLAPGSRTILVGANGGLELDIFTYFLY